jgi:DNA-binding CsgD family transcriptional regulator
MQTPLKFSTPTSARTKEQMVHGRPLIFADPSGYSPGFRYEKFADSPSMYRNVITWYLKAAGLRTGDIAAHLSISPSRVNGLAMRTRKQLFSGNTIETMRWLAKYDKIPPEEIPSHVFSAVKNEMWAAENALARCISADLFVTSNSLRLGRAHYLVAMEIAQGVKCSCDLCSRAPYDFTPYWGDE